jgi:hypothetical protein
MIKTDLAYEPSKLAYAQPATEPTAEQHDEGQQQKPEIDTYKPKSTSPKDELDLPQAPRLPSSTGATDRPVRECLTRRQAADFIRDELGRPMSFSTASKLAALGEFAQPAVWWGRRPLYTRLDLRRWVEARSRPHAKNTPQPAECQISKTVGQS